MEARKLNQRYTVEEYLAYDASLDGRAEYHDGDWVVKSYQGLDGQVELKSLGIKISMGKIYRLIDFPDGKTPLLPNNGKD